MLKKAPLWINATTDASIDLINDLTLDTLAPFIRDDNNSNSLSSPRVLNILISKIISLYKDSILPTSYIHPRCLGFSKPTTRAIWAQAHNDYKDADLYEAFLKEKQKEFKGPSLLKVGLFLTEFGNQIKDREDWKYTEAYIWGATVLRRREDNRFVLLLYDVGVKRQNVSRIKSEDLYKAQLQFVKAAIERWKICGIYIDNTADNKDKIIRDRKRKDRSYRGRDGKCLLHALTWFIGTLQEQETYFDQNLGD